MSQIKVRKIILRFQFFGVYWFPHSHPILCVITIFWKITTRFILSELWIAMINRFQRGSLWLKIAHEVCFQVIFHPFSGNTFYRIAWFHEKKGRRRRSINEWRGRNSLKEILLLQLSAEVKLIALLKNCCTLNAHLL
jgi:hypothetical protein